jgi:ribonuclease D
MFNKNSVCCIVYCMNEYKLIEKDEQLKALVEHWHEEGIHTVAMDFEGEFNLHIYGEHLCLVQLFDRKDFYIVDAMKVSGAALKVLLESDIEKIMFDCSGDSTLVRRVYGINLANVFDLRVVAQALGFVNGLSALIERNLKLGTEGKDGKKKKQMSNWLIRPLKPEQVSYALDDVKYLFDLRDSLDSELTDPDLRKKVARQMETCARPIHPDKPEWERAPGYKHMPHRTRIFLKHLYIARDNMARRRNCPASYLIDKKTLSRMAYAETSEKFEFMQPLRRDELDSLKKAISEAESELR